MILKSAHDTICLIDCKLSSATEMIVGLFYAEYTLESIVEVMDSETGKRYRVQLPKAISENKTATTGVNQVLKYENI